MPNSTAFLIDIVLLFGVLTFAILYFRQYYHNRSYQDSSQSVEEARLKSNEIIQTASKKAAEILAAAQIQSTKTSEDNKRIYEKLEVLLSNSIRERTNTFFEKFEENLSTYLTSTQQQSVKAIELELQSARNLIDTYKTTQLNLVDENIIAMLERSLSLVLIKKLSLQDQMELVYESLEKAKAEKFLG